MMVVQALGAASARPGLDLHLRHDPPVGRRHAFVRAVAADLRLVHAEPHHPRHDLLRLLHLLLPRTPVLVRLAIAVGIEVAWEIAENSPWVIEEYRKQATAAGYTGDSILNSLSWTRWR